MAKDVSELSDEEKIEILKQIQNNIGHEKLKTLVNSLGVDAVIERAMKVPDSKNTSCWDQVWMAIGIMLILGGAVEFFTTGPENGGLFTLLLMYIAFQFLIAIVKWLFMDSARNFILVVKITLVVLSLGFLVSYVFNRI